MKINKKIIGLCLFAGLLILPGKVCLAGKNPVLTLIAGEKKLQFTDKELLDLRGEGILTTFSPALKHNFEPQEIAADFYGQRLKKLPPLKFYKNSPKKIYKLLKLIATEVNLPALEPELEIQSNKVVKFNPPQNGINLNIYQNTLLVLSVMEKNQTQITLQTEQIFPQKKLEDTNALGINELVAIGESNFKGSPKNRRHNIAVGTEKYKGLIIQKGVEFSFNKNLGPVVAETGFLPELVIKKTGTVPEFGGGLCQVSSTAFRAAMNAGLPITQRKNHSYAVQYYSPQGTDATIYPGAVDLKFINDTPGAILIWPYLKDKDSLVFEFYGSKDARQVNIEAPVQYDKKPDGSMKAYWNRSVVKNGIEKKDTFKSIYLSPALFHKQEEFVKPSTIQDSIKMLQ